MRNPRQTSVAVAFLTIFVPQSLVVSSLMEQVNTEGPFQVPSFSLSDLRAGRHLDSLATALTSHGIFAVPQEDSEFEELKNSALQGWCQCANQNNAVQSRRQRQAGVLSVEGADSSLLSDGKTRRTTLATATVGEVPLPLPAEQLDQACNFPEGVSLAASMDQLRDQVSETSGVFLQALDSILHKTKVSQEEQNQARQQPLLRNVNGGAYHSLQQVIQASTHLEHFHLYSREHEEDSSEDDATATLRTPVDQALDLHTDAGLFLAFVPAYSCGQDKQKQDDASFVMYDTEAKSTRQVQFPANSIAIMLGIGAEQWIGHNRDLLPLKATRHAVKSLGRGGGRSWYGMMHLVPEGAIIRPHPTQPRTFADMRQAMALQRATLQTSFPEKTNLQPKPPTFGQHQRGFEEEDVALGCGIHTLNTTKSTIVPDVTATSQFFSREKRRARLQMVADASACNNKTNFYCWMSCLSVPSAENASDYIDAGYSLYCLDPSMVDGASSQQEGVVKAVEECEMNGVPGAAMNAACMGRWETTVPGVPSQELNISKSTGSGGGSGSEQPPFCYGATSMLMQGFEWNSAVCIVYLFSSWLLNTHGKFIAACFGSVLFGILVEWIIKGRRMVMTVLSPGWKKLAASAGFYGVQLCMGYLIMLVIMTYSGPLFVSVVIGLMLGHVSCHYQTLLFSNGSTRSNTGGCVDVVEGITPCCQNDLRQPASAAGTGDGGEALGASGDRATMVEMALPCCGTDSTKTDNLKRDLTDNLRAESDEDGATEGTAAECCCEGGESGNGEALTYGSIGKAA